MSATPSAWRNRVFLKIWLASLLSGAAVAAHDTAATWMMNLMSPSGLFISLMASLASLPFFLFTLPAGALADAFNAGIILRLANLWLAGMCRSLGVSGLGRHAEPDTASRGRVCARSGLCGHAPAWASLVPQLVTNEELPSVLTLGGLQLNISGILGPALAGILLSRLAAPFVFALNAAGFLLVFLAIPALPKKGCESGRTLLSFVGSISTSVRYVAQTKNVRNILFRNGVFSSLVVVIPALMPVVLLKELRLDGSSLGLVFASMGVGSVVGATFVIPWLRSRFATEHLMLIAQIILAGVYLLMAMVHHCLYCLIPMTF
jgi:hypothetical protein